MLPTTRSSHRSAALATTIALGLGLSLLIASPAAAASVSDLASFEAEISATGTDPTVSLSADIAAGALTVDRSVTVDLNGHDVTSESVTVAPGLSLTIVDSSGGATGSWTATGASTYAGFAITGATLTITSGTVTASSAGYAAGIGGDYYEDGGTLNVTGGTVTATGGVYSAGIGGGNGGGAGTTTISDGIVNAYSGGQAAAIGGGNANDGGTTTITGGTVTAIGSQSGAGIGGGVGGTAGVTLITGGTVTATGGTYAAGIGSGRYATNDGSITILGGTVNATGGVDAAGIGGHSSGTTTTIAGGTVTAIGGTNGAGIGTGNDGNNARPLTLGSAAPSTSTLNLSASSLRTSATTITAGTTVTVPSATTLSVESPLNNDGLIVVDGTLTGNDTITNNGSIRPAANVNAAGLTITVNNFDITFISLSPVDTTSYRAYAPTLADSGYLSSGISNPGFVVDSWNTQSNGSGSDVALGTLLDSVDTAGDITLWATWIAQELNLTSAASSATVDGTVTSFVSTLSGDLGLSTVVSATAALTSSDPADAVVDDVITFATVGARTVTSTHLGLIATLPVSIATGALDSVTITPSASSVAQGGTLSFTVEGADVDSNPIVILPADVVLTSDVATDVVNGLTVSFPHASPHVITATVRGVSDSFAIEVRAAALAATGLSLTNQTLAAGAVLIAVGGLLLALRSRRRAA